MSKLVKSSIGSFAAQTGLSLVEFIGTMLVATIGGPSMLGTYVLFVVVYDVGTLLSNLGVWEATVKRIAEGDSRGEFLAASFLTRGALLVPVLLFLVVFQDSIVDYIGDPVATPFLLATVSMVVLVETVSAGLHGEQMVARSRSSALVGSVGKVVIWGALLWLGYGLVGLLVGLLASKLLHVIVGVQFLSIRPRVPNRRHFQRLFQFSRYSWLGSMKKRAWIWTDTLVLGFFVASGLIGVYELSWRLSAAFFLISMAVSSVLFANVDQLLESKGPDAVSRAVSESLVYTGILVIPGVVGGIVMARPLLTAFGSEYAIGYPVFVVLLLARLSHCYENVFAKVVNALDRPDLMFRANGMFILLNVVGNVVAIATYGWIGAAVATAVSMSVRTLMAYRYLTSLIDLTIPRREILLETLAALMMGAVLLWVTRGGPTSTLWTVLTIGGGATLYGILVLAFIGRVRTRVRSLVTPFI
ncbi:lipopolysaccharide biosynthesis protein [Halorarum halophilum]|uniref:Lipopolysaccharide biosynthesis protein n=1 Tax=Halorarum halophilum TaxID=2743090 RepID=A0A7D5GDS9_9EURY|nr:lipopolysaccharide biosynthesis protein [Halobaculum halophilum]QLG29212.1 lipopolysaccharide biosynthesis protein [Halobaculum halophilum]